MLSSLEADLKDEDFELFRKLIWTESGISLGKNKLELVRSRLLPRLRSVGCPSFRHYYRYVLSDSTQQEMRRLLDAISTNLTSFFRESIHFEYLTKHVLPDLVSLKKNHNKSRQTCHLRCWSAGCSTGEETYSLAIALSEFAKDHPNMVLKILGTDISEKVLSTAQRGVYAQDRLENVPAPLLRQYFQRGIGQWSGHLRVKPALANIVTFSRHNLLENVPFRDVDIIFCRNVMIYFDREIQQRVIESFRRTLSPKGYLFVGHSESLAGLNEKLRYIRPAIYQRL